MNWKNAINPETLRVVDADKSETKTSLTVHLDIIFGRELVVRFQIVFTHLFPILTVNCRTNCQFQIPYDHVGSLIVARTLFLNLPNNQSVFDAQSPPPPGDRNLPRSKLDGITMESVPTDRNNFGQKGSKQGRANKKKHTNRNYCCPSLLGGSHLGRVAQARFCSFHLTASIGKRIPLS